MILTCNSHVNSPLRHQKCHFWPFLTFFCLFSLGEGSKKFFRPKKFFSCKLTQSGSKMTNLVVITFFGNLCLISSQSSKTHFCPFSPKNWIQAKYRGPKNPGDKALWTICYQNPSISWRFRPIRTKINHHFIGRNFFPPGPNWARTILQRGCSSITIDQEGREDI